MTEDSTRSEIREHNGVKLTCYLWQVMSHNFTNKNRARQRNQEVVNEESRIKQNLQTSDDK